MGVGGGKGWGIKRVGATPNPITRFLSHAPRLLPNHMRLYVSLYNKQLLPDIIMMMIKIRYLLTSQSLSPRQLVCMPWMEQAVS